MPAKPVFLVYVTLAALACGILAACAPAQTAGAPTLQAPAATTAAPVTRAPAAKPSLEPQAAPSATAGPVSSSTAADPLAPSSTPRPTLAVDEWKSLPVLPTLSARALAILADGLAKGNNPRVFSKIGDCESRTTWFLNDFDGSPKNYSLGPYQDLQATIGYYSGSFARMSVAARPGFTTASLLTTYWSDPKLCQSGENPLDCEYRINRPSMAFIMLGTNDVSHPEAFEGNLRRIIGDTIARGILPVLATKADNREGDNSINATIARLAVEYDLPLWNYWAAVQGIPDQGLQDDKAHLTFMPNRFDDPEAMKRAWPLRNLEALQVLQMVMNAIQKPATN